MKKFKCPSCGNLTESLICKVGGECVRNIDGDAELEYWEIGKASCEECGFEEGWSDYFEVVDVED